MTRAIHTVYPSILVAFSLLITLLPTSLAKLLVENGQLVVLDASGITAQKFEFSAKTASGPTPVFELNSENTLKATFDILAKSSSEKTGKPISPHQVTLLATGVDTKLNWATPIKTRSTGKAKWELDLARAPTDFLSLSRTGKVQLELLIGDVSSTHAPLRIKLPILKIPASLLLEYPYWDTKNGKPPATLELEKYYIQPEQKWTFQPPRKKDNPIFSLAFVGIAMSPWIFLLTVWSRLSRSTAGGFKLFSFPKSSTLLFLLTLVSQEALILTYWAKLRLYQYLPLAFLASLPLILTGRTALSELRVRRRISPISSGHVTVAQFFGKASKNKTH